MSSGIYRWENGARLDVFKDQAVIYLKPEQTEQERDALVARLRASGYAVDPDYVIEPKGKHRLAITAASEAEANKIAADYRQLAEMINHDALKAHQSAIEQIEHDPTLSDQERKGAIAELKTPEITSVSTEGTQVVISGIPQRRIAEELQRRASFHHRLPASSVEHVVEGAPSERAIFVHHRTSADHLVQQLQSLGWGKGKVRDQYDGLSVAQKALSKVLDNADILAPAFYLSGDLRILYSTAQDSRRRGIKLTEHEGFAEGAGFAVGTTLWGAHSLLNKPSSVDDVLGRFESNFRVGNRLDFGKSAGFSPEGSTLGTVPSTLRTSAQGAGRWGMMLANIWAGTGLLRARYGEIMATETTDGFRNIVINPKSGEVEKAHRFRPQNIISGAVLVFSATLFAFLSKRGSDKPDFDYGAISDRIRSTPLLGAAYSGAVRFFNETGIGRTLAAPVNRLFFAMGKDPFAFGGPLVTVHNLQQIGFNAVDFVRLRGERDQMATQLARTLQMVDDFLADERAPFPSLGKKVDVSSLTVDERRSLAQAIKSMIEAGVELDQSQPRYHAGTPEYAEKLKHPKDFKDYMQLFQERVDDRSRTVAPLEWALGTFANNMEFFHQLNQEVAQFTSRTLGYFQMTAASYLLSHAGERDPSLINAAQGAISPRVVMERAAQVMHEHDSSITDEKIANAATALGIDKDFGKTQLGKTAVVEQLKASLEQAKTLDAHLIPSATPNQIQALG